VAKLELFGMARCPYTRDMREWLEWKGNEFIEYDVEADDAARERLRELIGRQNTVPVLVENGKVAQIGWQGQGCAIPGD
jgi:glutaredoxin